MMDLIKLFDNSPRRVCFRSFAYGLFVGIMIICGLIGVINLDGVFLAASFVSAVLGKISHGFLPQLNSNELNQNKGF
ncbi:MAG TPA: hypothetical protein VIY47_01845 [Ignavibacteriaceae bacterium]